MTANAVHARDVPDDVALALRTPDIEAEHGCRWPYFARYPSFPRKVILAKLRSLQRAGKLRGCAEERCLHGRDVPKVRAIATCDHCKASVPVMDENDVVLEEIEHAIQGCNGGLNT